KHVIVAVASELESRAMSIPVVVDPVMVAKGGASLLREDARTALIERLIPLCALLTPNLPEAAALTGLPAEDEADMDRLADALLELGAAAVLVKGGHLASDRIVDLLRTADGLEHRFESKRIVTRSSHGTGCTLASAIATGIAEGMTLVSAIDRARTFVRRALEFAPGLGAGHGPLHHGWPITHPEAQRTPAKQVFQGE
ncbi:MAG TPA: bifunctional hydroxymethylpyrimidine kinase/phosphomethylpyrimidine kinase, partial [Polyangiaceae bacterium]|nr:bifunctional hydroxymethylpyrimidine kinase/phosphomethylpyrimidine kinase [Polyangiaceae bacterium]